MTTTRTLGALSVALVAALALPACGNDAARSGTDSAAVVDATGGALGGGSATTAAAAPGTTAAASGGKAVADEAGRATGLGTSSGTVPSGPTPVPAPPADRKVIVAVTLDLEVANVATAGAKVASMAETLGGYVQSQQAAFAGDRPSSTLVVRVPPERVTDLLTSVAGLGKVVNQTQQAEDVTGQFVDLESRIATARASVARVRGFLDRTSNVNELSSLEAELTRRETELEQLVAAQQGLAARAALATVTVGLVPVTAPTTADDDERPMTPGRALHRGVDALAAVGTGLAVFAAFLLPFLPVAAVVLAVVYAVRRRNRRRAAVTTVAAAAPEREPVDA